MLNDGICTERAGHSDIVGSRYGRKRRDDINLSVDCWQSLELERIAPSSGAAWKSRRIAIAASGGTHRPVPLDAITNLETVWIAP
jgi:hypothetical protein